jgi:hypothetical protein
MKSGGLRGIPLSTSTNVNAGDKSLIMYFTRHFL